MYCDELLRAADCGDYPSRTHLLCRLIAFFFFKQPLRVVVPGVGSRIIPETPRCHHAVVQGGGTDRIVAALLQRQSQFALVGGGKGRQSQQEHFEFLFRYNVIAIRIGLQNDGQYVLELLGFLKALMHMCCGFNGMVQ